MSGAIESGDALHVNFYVVILEMDLRRKHVFAGGLSLLPIMAAALTGFTGAVQQLLQSTTLALLTTADLDQLAQRATAEKDIHFRNRLVICHNCIINALSLNKTSEGVPSWSLRPPTGHVDLVFYYYLRLVNHCINTVHKRFSSPATDRYLDCIRLSFQEHVYGIIMFMLVGLFVAKISALLESV